MATQPQTLGTPVEQLAAVPAHIAIIMDGNGRWAKQRGLPRLAGHRAGTENIRKIIEGCVEFGVQYLTLYAFSTENWRRPEDEISALMGLLKHFIVSDLDEFAENDVRLKVLGDYRAFAPDVVELVEQALAEFTRRERRYGGR